MSQQSSPLSQKEIASIQQFPCNGVPLYKVGFQKDLTYSQAYSAIFKAEKCSIVKEGANQGHRTFTQSGMRRIKNLNTLYWTRFKDFVRKTWDDQKKETAELMAQLEQAKTAGDQFAAWEKELEELAQLREGLNAGGRMLEQKDHDRALELRELMEASSFMRDSEGKLATKPHAAPEPVEAL